MDVYNISIALNISETEVGKIMKDLVCQRKRGRVLKKEEEGGAWHCD